MLLGYMNACKKQVLIEVLDLSRLLFKNSNISLHTIVISDHSMQQCEILFGEENEKEHPKKKMLNAVKYKILNCFKLGKNHMDVQWTPKRLHRPYIIA